MKTGQIFRSKKTGKSRYTPISNDVIQSTTLTPYEKIILIYMLSLPEDWVIYKTQIQGKVGLSRKVFGDGWKGLVDKGYIHSKQIKREGSNLMGGYIHKIFEEPVLSFNEDTDTEHSTTELTAYGVPEAGTLQSNNIQSNKIQSNKIENNNTSTSTRSSIDFFNLNSDLQREIEKELDRLLTKSKVL
jgi:hypothetical protein